MSEEKPNKFRPYFKRLSLPGLKPTDYFLFKNLRDTYQLDTRQILVIGLRWIYAAHHEEYLKTMVKSIITQVQNEDLDQEAEPRPIYKELRNL